MKTTRKPWFALLNYKLSVALLLLSATLLLATVKPHIAFAATGDWSMGGFDATNAAYNPATTLTSPATLVPGWSGGFGSYGTSQVVIGDGVAVTTGVRDAGQGYGVQAYNTSTGALLWQIGSSSSSYSLSAPAIANGVVYVSSGSGIQAYNATTGGLIWTSAANIATQQSLTLANGLLYVASDHLYALNISTGATVWSDPLGAAGTAPAIANNMVYVGSNSNTLDAFNARTGALVWVDGLSATPTAIAVSGSVWLGANNGHVSAYNPNSGALLQDTASGSSSIVSLAVAPYASSSSVFVGTNDGHVDLLGRWSDRISSSGGNVYISLTGRSMGNITLEPFVYATSFSGTFAISTLGNSHSVVWSDSTDDGTATPVVSQGVLYVSSASRFQTYQSPPSCIPGC